MFPIYQTLTRSRAISDANQRWVNNKLLLTSLCTLCILYCLYICICMSVLSVHVCACSLRRSHANLPHLLFVAFKLFPMRYGFLLIVRRQRAKHTCAFVCLCVCGLFMFAFHFRCLLISIFTFVSVCMNFSIFFSHFHPRRA